MTDHSKEDTVNTEPHRPYQKGTEIMDNAIDDDTAELNRRLGVLHELLESHTNTVAECAYIASWDPHRYDYCNALTDQGDGSSTRYPVGYPSAFALVAQTASAAEFREFVARLEAPLRLAQQAAEALRKLEAAKIAVLEATELFEPRWNAKQRPRGLQGPSTPPAPPAN